MEMGPQAECDNDLGQGRRCSGSRELCWTWGARGAACVPSPKKDMRSQLQASEPWRVMGTMAEVGGGVLLTCPPGSLALQLSPGSPRNHTPVCSTEVTQALRNVRLSRKELLQDAAKVASVLWGTGTQ